MEITPLQRAQIVELACLDPVAKGLHIAHWSSDDPARQAVADGIVARIGPRAVRDILSDVDLQPHRTQGRRSLSVNRQKRRRQSTESVRTAGTPAPAQTVSIF